jgi:hypothetical protein
MRPISIINIGFLLRLLWAGVIAYRGFELGLEADAQKFYIDILDIARTGNFVEFETGPNLVLNIVSFFLMPFGDALFLACAIGCLAWWGAGYFFVASLKILNATAKQKRWAAVLFALWPTAIPYTAIPLRESFQLCFVNMAVFGALSLLTYRQLRYWALVILGVFLAGRLHGGLATFGLAVVALTMLFYSLTSGRKFPMLFFVFGSAAVLGVLYFGDTLLSASSYDLSEGTLTSIEKYQQGGLGEYARSAYKEEIASLNSVSAIVALPIGFFQYLFEPFPQKISSLSDVALALENLMRFLILVSIPATVRKLESPFGKRVLLFLAALYMSQEFIWSVGTVNWGTASRHHVPAIGILMLVAAHLQFFAKLGRKASPVYQSATSQFISPNQRPSSSV